jgi:hypothetical protein
MYIGTVPSKASIQQYSTYYQSLRCTRHQHNTIKMCNYWMHTSLITYMNHWSWRKGVVWNYKYNITTRLKTYDSLVHNKIQNSQQQKSTAHHIIHVGVTVHEKCNRHHQIHQCNHSGLPWQKILDLIWTTWGTWRIHTKCQSTEIITRLTSYLFYSFKICFLYFIQWYTHSF